MFAQLCALAVAIEKAGSLDTGAVASQLRALSLFEFWGNISFDANGQASAKELLVLQNIHKDGFDSKVHVVDVSSIVFPMPTWPQR
eukprot:1043308-Prymnesium_polylepis.1